MKKRRTKVAFGSYGMKISENEKEVYVFRSGGYWAVSNNWDKSIRYFSFRESAFKHALRQKFLNP